jgi:hypothetical protein
MCIRIYTAGAKQMEYLEGRKSRDFYTRMAQQRNVDGDTTVVTIIEGLEWTYCTFMEEIAGWCAQRYVKGGYTLHIRDTAWRYTYAGKGEDLQKFLHKEDSYKHG